MAKSRCDNTLLMPPNIFTPLAAPQSDDAFLRKQFIGRRRGWVRS